MHALDSPVPPVRATTAVRLHAVRATRIDLVGARAAMEDLAWLGRPAEGPPDEPEMRRIVADLELPILDGGGGLRSVRKAALIDVGPARETQDAIVVPVAWQSATHAPLFPVLAGELHIRRDGLVLDGRYVPPFGRVGLVIDGTLLHFVARRTAQAFLARIAARLGS